MSRPLTQEELDAAIQRAIDSRLAAGLPRYVQDGPTLDGIAAIVAASQRARARERAASAGRQKRRAQT